MSEGTVGCWVVGLYLRSVGAFLTLCIVISLVLMQLSQNFTFIWLTFWVRNKSNNTADSPVDNVHENTTALDHGFNIVDNAVHKIVNTTIDIINNFSGNSGDVPTDDSRNETTSGYMERPSVLKASGLTDNYYLEVYFGLAALNLVFTIMRAFLFAYGGVKAAAKIHKALLKVIVKVCIIDCY